jgi:hypothetical protein
MISAQAGVPSLSANVSIGSGDSNAPGGTTPYSHTLLNQITIMIIIITIIMIMIMIIIITIMIIMIMIMIVMNLFAPLDALSKQPLQLSTIRQRRAQQKQMYFGLNRKRVSMGERERERERERGREKRRAVPC